MRTTFRHLARFLAIVAVLGLIHAALGPAGPASGPYLSALSDLGAGALQAAPTHCSNRACTSTVTCGKFAGYNCGVGDFCRERPC